MEGTKAGAGVAGWGGAGEEWEEVQPTGEAGPPLMGCEEVVIYSAMERGSLSCLHSSPSQFYLLYK